LLDDSDQAHADAVRILTQTAGERFRQFVTNAVVIEAHALILSALGIRVASRFLRDIDNSNTVVVRIRAVDEERANQIIYQYDDKDFSLTDAISFAVMERLGISRALTFDRHFEQYGFQALARPLTVLGVRPNVAGASNRCKELSCRPLF